MLKALKHRIDSHLEKFLKRLDRDYLLSRISPLLFSAIRDFVSRDGKRVRPILFVCGYLGFKDKPAAGLYDTALSIELLHDFMLVHDDIIDKSDTRRGKPSMHKLLGVHLKDIPGAKFSGQDLAIVAGDVMYATAIRAFLSVKEDMRRKEEALKKFIEAAVYTGSGEFIELLLGAKDIAAIEKNEIYRIYDYKTAYYTFACPLSSGAILAGAPAGECRKLSSYGINLGRAFQIKDDILGMFSEEEATGKSSLADLREGKKTLLVCQAYRNLAERGRKELRRLLGKKNAGRNDLKRIRKLILESGALEYAQREVSRIKKLSQNTLCSSSMKPRYKQFLLRYTEEIL